MEMNMPLHWLIAFASKTNSPRAHWNELNQSCQPLKFSSFSTIFLNFARLPTMTFPCLRFQQHSSDISSDSLTYLYCIQSMNFCSFFAAWPIRENDLFCLRTHWTSPQAAACHPAILPSKYPGILWGLDCSPAFPFLRILSHSFHYTRQDFVSNWFCLKLDL